MALSPQPPGDPNTRGHDSVEALLLESRERLASSLLIASSVVAVPFCSLTIWEHVSSGKLWAAGATVLLLAGILFGALTPTLPWRYRAGIALAATYGAGVFGLLTMGLAGGAFAALCGFVALSPIMLGWRAAWPALLLAAATVALCCALHFSGYYVVPLPTMLDPTEPANWLRVTGTWVVVTVAVAASVVFLLRDLSGALHRQSLLLAELKDENEQRQRTSVQLENTQERLSQAEKLESLGRLASGVAHDFNNTLTVILSSAEMIGAQVGDNPQLKRLVNHLTDASQQGAALTQQLLSLQRGQVGRPEILDATQLLVRTSELLERVLPRDVEVLAPDPEQAPMYVRIDPTQLSQALLNLALNARDAMPDGGTLKLCAEREPLLLGNDAHLVPGTYVCVSVEDSGSGMEPAVVERIFEPFFTTKESGGTGLGLPNVREMARAAGGALTVRSQVGQGSRFSLYLPESDRRVSGIESVLGRQSQGSTVLVVEDEPQVRGLLETILREEGHDVLSAGSGKQALELLRERDTGVGLILADLLMPDLKGHELIRELRALQPGVSIVVSSADRNDAEVHALMTEGHLSAVSKPFTRRQLVSVVRSSLSKAAMRANVD